MLVKNLPPVEREVPHEPGNWFSFRRLSAAEMDEAQADAVKETLNRYGTEAMEALSKMAVPDAARQASQEDPLAGHSPETLVRYGLVGWRGPDYPGDDFSDEKKRELDAPTRKWAALQVLEMGSISAGEVPSSGDGSGPTSAITAGHSRGS